MYEYQATILRVIDGDTVEARVDLGFEVSLVERFRLRGINAPEMKGPSRDSGRAAADYLRTLISTETGTTGAVLLRTTKDRKEKYGRYLAVIVANGQDLNAAMVKNGHAVSYMETE